MMIRSVLLGGLVAALALAPACKQQEPRTSGGVRPDAAGSAGRAGGGEAGGTAAGGAVGELPLVSDCPKSLAGNEKVARTIKKECGPITITESYGVDGSLTLEAGVVLRFAAGTSLDVGYYGPAKLIVRGTAQDPVVLTSAGDQVPGAWQGVRLHQQAARSSLDGLVIEHAGDGDRGALQVDAVDVTFKNSTLRKAREVGLRAGDQATFAEFTGNRFEEAGKVAVSVAPFTVSTLGPGNHLAADAFVEVRHGAIDRNATWRPVGARFHVIEDVNVDGKNGRATLELEAGVELAFAAGAELAIGYYTAGGLKIAGRKDLPVRLVGIERRPDGWTGLRVYDSGEATIEQAIFESGGGEDGKGALAVTGGSLTVKDALFRGNRLGLSVQADAKKFAGDRLVFEGNGQAVLITAEQFAGLGAGNRFAARQQLELRGGTATKDLTWNLQPGAAILVSEDLLLDKGKLRVAPGSELAFKEGVEWSVGYHDEASLELRGTAELPIRLRGERDEKDSWDGVRIYDHARGSVIEHVELTNVAGEAGVKVQRGRVKVTRTSCKGCVATLAWDCGAKVEQADVTGKVAAPLGCP